MAAPQQMNFSPPRWPKLYSQSPYASPSRPEATTSPIRDTASPSRTQTHYRYAPRVDSSPPGSKATATLPSPSSSVPMIEDDAVETTSPVQRTTHPSRLAGVENQILTDAVKTRIIDASHNVCHTSLAALLRRLPQGHKLDKCDISFNEIEDIEHVVSALYAQHLSVATLLANNNKMSHVSLRLRLDLSFNKLCELPPGISEACPTLSVLNMSHNRLTTLPVDLFACSRLTELDMSHNTILELPSSLQCPLLRVLNVSFNSLSSVPSNLWDLSALEVVDLSHNSIADIPAISTLLNSLKFIDFSDNMVTQLPGGLYLCNSLETLYISNNKIENIPEDSIPQSCKHVNLSGNNLTTVPSSLLNDRKVSLHVTTRIKRKTRQSVRDLKSRVYFSDNDGTETITTPAVSRSREPPVVYVPTSLSWTSRSRMFDYAPLCASFLLGVVIGRLLKR